MRNKTHSVPEIQSGHKAEFSTYETDPEIVIPYSSNKGYACSRKEVRDKKAEVAKDCDKINSDLTSLYSSKRKPCDN